MITEKDLEEAIAECQGQRNPNASTCIKLAAFLTIKEALFGRKETPMYSFASEPINDQSLVEYDGESEFAREIDGRKQKDVWTIMDELMDVLKATNPRLYAGVMRKLQD